MQEMQSCNIGIRRIPKPYVYPQYDNTDRDLSKIEEYTEETYRNLNRQVEDMIDDSNTAVDTE